MADKNAVPLFHPQSGPAGAIGNVLDDRPHVEGDGMDAFHHVIRCACCERLALPGPTPPSRLLCTAPQRRSNCHPLAATPGPVISYGSLMPIVNSRARPGGRGCRPFSTPLLGTISCPPQRSK